MKENRPKIFIVAGETSGDERGKEIVKELKQLISEIDFRGLGSSKLKSEGVDIIFDLPSVAVIGLTDVLKKYFFFRKIFFNTLTEIKNYKPNGVLLIDYPGFNLRLAKKVKKLKIPVIFYVSPQIWAWAPWRKKKIAKIVDKMLLILPFEEKIYKDTGIDAEFIGHPLIDKTAFILDKGKIIKDKYNLSGKTVISILSGSRKGEVERILPVFIEAAKLISKENKNIIFLISKAPKIENSIYKKLLFNAGIPYLLIFDEITSIIDASDFCWITSGTATLEATLRIKPFLIAYKTSLITYILGRILVRINFIGLANIIAGKKIVEEFIQYDLTPEKIYSHTSTTLRDKAKLEKIKTDLKKVKESLGSPGAAKRGAKAIKDFLQL